jgi:ribosomal peptide maturation radical SAM protein 1
VKADQGVDVCLVVPPFAQVEMPTLAPAILTPAIRARGLSVRTIHANILLAGRMGGRAYHLLSESPRQDMAAERVFRPFAYPETVRDRLEPPKPLPRKLQEAHDAAAAQAEAFLDECCVRILALKPRILGISSVFQQNLASSAIALRIKQAAPETCIVLGGPNAASPMGEALAEIFPWIDYFFAGEADIAFADFCEKLVRDGVRPAERVIHCPPLMDMRRSPAPDFTDYFEALREAQAAGKLADNLPEMLAIETSRGCWWGAKHHCTFCGLNGETMAFRAKPPEQALAELDALEAAWGVGRYMAADNIIPQSYLNNLVPALAAREGDLDIFYEVKANLSPAQLAAMHRAGIVRIQPGIESLSSNVLRLMRKGVRR